MGEKVKNEKRKKNNSSVSITDMEPDTFNALLGKKKITGFDSQVDIHFHSLRHRLTDPDGMSAKAVIDGCVIAKLFPDDSAKEIRFVTFSQEKIPGSEKEKTIITIIEG